MKWKYDYKTFTACMLLLVLILSCTKLDTRIYDQVSAGDQVAADIGPAYSWLRDYSGSIYNLNEISTDEIIVPKRGADWADDVIWEQIWKHIWNPENRFINDAWFFIYGGIARVNSILDILYKLNSKPADYNKTVAELKTIRAFYQYIALDLFGNVPIADSNYTNLAKLPTKSRAEVFAFVEKELKDNLAFISTEVNTQTYGRATQWFAHALLAKLYLNAQVYTGTARWVDCNAACDAILNSNKFLLEPDFFSNFKIANEGSRENIFVIPFDIQAGLNWFVIQGFTLHYESYKTFGLESGGYNGYCTAAEHYNLFNPADKRRKMFLVGQQYKNQDSTNPANILYDKSGYRLIFDPVITSFSLQDSSIERAGARCAKWEFNKEGIGNMSNDFAVIRLADVILMKAEAQFRNGSTTDALTTINQQTNGVSIRNRAGLPDFSSAEMNPDGLLRERACELSWEGWRRNDMIRLGHFTDARVPEKASSRDFRKLYPIPQTELAKNPYLVQNLGY